MLPGGFDMALGDLGQDLLVVEDSCLLADLEGRELGEYHTPRMCG